VTRLLDLEPTWCEASWLDAHGARQPSEGRQGMGVMFRCPVHFPRGEDCDFSFLYVPFVNPVDGRPKAAEGQSTRKDAYWQREGETFETLTLRPSIKFPEQGPEHWHGYVTNGDVA
jgi:hypothetical protein